MKPTLAIGIIVAGEGVEGISDGIVDVAKDQLECCPEVSNFSIEKFVEEKWRNIINR